MTTHKNLLIAVLLMAGVFSMQAQTPLSGMPIGSPGAVNHELAMAFDGDASTWFESANHLSAEERLAGQYGSFRNNWIAYAGLQLDVPHVITRFRLQTPANHAAGALLGIVQGANRADFSDAVPLYIIKEAQADGIYEADIQCSKGFRYVRFVGPSNPDVVSNLSCYVSELQFYGTEGEGDDSQYYQLTNLPTVVVNTSPDNPATPWLLPQAWDKEEDVVSNIIFIKDNLLNLQALGSTRERGNNSRIYAKKPMRIKFEKKQKPLDAKANKKKWTLINSAPDNTLMRNALAFEISRRVGMAYTPYCQTVDLVYNGEYRGTYQFCDQVELADKRIEGDELEPTDLREPALTGAYHCEIDYYASQEATGCWFEIPNGFPVTIKSPDMEGTTDNPGPTVPEQYEYIKNYWAKAYHAADPNTPNRLDPVDGWRGWFDADSWYRYAIVEEIVGNSDAATSIHNVKRRNDPRIYAACVWDHDKAFGNGGPGYADIYTSSSFTKGNSTGSSAGFIRWLTRENTADENAKYNAEVSALWSYLRNKPTDNVSRESLAAWIEEKRTEFAASADLNFKRWGYGTGINDEEKASWTAAVDHLKAWVLGRIDNIENPETGIISYDPTITEYPVEETFTPETNLALYKHATATTSKVNEMPFCAVDGKPNNYWDNYLGSIAADAEGIRLQNFTVDLGKNYPVNKVVINWRDICAGRKYDIQLSADGEHYLTVAAKTDDTEIPLAAGTIYRPATYTFEAYNARYVRMQGREPVNMGNGYAICELMVYGTTEGNVSEIPADAADAVNHVYDIPDPTKSLAYKKTVTVTSTEGGNSGANAVDGDFGTRWANDWNNDAVRPVVNTQSLTVDLGAEYMVHTVYTYWEAAHGEDFNIEVSTDGETFTPAAQVTGGRQGDTKYSFDPVRARYVRMQGVKASNQYGYSLYEFLVYGDEIPVEAATVTISIARYATYVLPFDIDFSYTPNLNVYRVDQVNSKGQAVLKDDFGREAHAGDAVVLAGEEGIYTLYRAADEVPSISEAYTNLLKASDGTVTGDNETIYALAVKNDVTGFYLVGEGVHVPAGKAYLQRTDGAAAAKFDYLPFTWDDGTTGISSLTPNPSPKGEGSKYVYDLQGRKVASLMNSEERTMKNSLFTNHYSSGQRPKPGIYIVGGKKFVVR